MNFILNNRKMNNNPNIFGMFNSSNQNGNSNGGESFNPNYPMNENPSYFSGQNFGNMNKNNNIQNNSQSNQSESMKKEIQLENEIRDHLKCYICLTKVNKPAMCKYCKKICCLPCINKWLVNHHFCGMCKHLITHQDMIPLPFLDDMSTYFIANIDNHPKNNPNNINQNQNNIGMKNNNKINISNKNQQNINESNDNKDICPKHKTKIDYYCIQCNKYFCSNCLVFFSEEGKKHQNHLVLPLSKMNNLGIKEAVNQYKQLPQTKNIIDNLIALINMRLKENEIKKENTKNYIKLIEDLYLKKIEDNTKELKAILTNLTSQKDSIETSINSVPNGFSNIVDRNDFVQGSIVSKDLQKLNRVNENLENEIKEISEINPKLYIENYETDLLEINIPYGGQYNEGLELTNYKLDIIPNYPSRLIMQYLQGKIIISFCVDIDAPLNAPNYPKFYSYIVFKNLEYGAQLLNLPSQSLIQENRDKFGRIMKQINSTEFDAHQFLVLGGNDKIIRLKLFIIKTYK